MTKNTQGFSKYLKEKDRFGFGLHYPLTSLGKNLYQEIQESQDLDVFCRNYVIGILKAIPMNSFHLGFGSAGWQLAANYSKDLSLVIFSIRTGFLDSIFYNCSGLTFSLDPFKNKLISLVSKFLPVWFADGLWQFVRESTDNPVQHWFSYLAVSFLFLAAYYGQNKGLKKC